MKKFIVALLILVLLATGAYAGFGLLARQNVMTGMASIQKQLPGVIERDIKGGLFQSQVHVRIPLPHLEEIDRNAALVIDETIYHGPFIFSGKEKGVPQTLAQAYGTGTIVLELPGVTLPSQVKELLQAHLDLRVPLVGASVLTVAGQPLQHSVDLANGKQLRVDWQGFTLDMTFTGNSLLNYTLALHAPGLELQDNGGNLLALRGLSASGAMTESASGLSVGSVQSGLEELEARLVAQDDHVLAKGVSGTISSMEENGLLTLTEKFVMASLAFDDKDFSKLNFQLALRNLPAQTVVDFGHALQAIEADPAAQNDPKLAQQQVQEVISRLGPALLAGSPELALEDVSFVVPQGKLHFHGALRFNGDGKVLLNPIFLLGRLSADGFFEADKAALEEIVRENVKWGSCPDPQDLACANQALDTAIAKLADYVASGMLVRNPTTYSYTMSFKDGQIMVNGKSQPLPLANLGS